MFKTRVTVLPVALAAAFAFLPGGALGRTSTRARTPTIIAKPASTMVNSMITLKGRGFTAQASIRLRECGQRSWLDPRVPCNAANEVSVVTGANGRFTRGARLKSAPKANRSKRSRSDAATSACPFRAKTPGRSNRRSGSPSPIRSLMAWCRLPQSRWVARCCRGAVGLGGMAGGSPAVGRAARR